MSRKFTAASLLAVFAASSLLVACNEPTRYDAANFSDSASVTKSADKYWKREGWWGGIPKDVKKVAITQFAIEYVTENINKSGADGLSILGVMEMGGMGRRQRQYDETFKREFPATLYTKFVDVLKSEGLDVVPLADLQKHPAFNELKTAGEGAGFRGSARDLLGRADNSQQVKGQAFPMPGLPLVDDGWFNAGTNAQAEAKLIGESGATAGLRVRFRVALNDDGFAILDTGSSIHAMYGLQRAGSGPQNTPTWFISQRGNLTSSGAFRDDVAVVDSKEFKMFKGDVYTVNTPKFQASVEKMFPTFARMAVIKLKS